MYSNDGFYMFSRLKKLFLKHRFQTFVFVFALVFFCNFFIIKNPANALIRLIDLDTGIVLDSSWQNGSGYVAQNVPCWWPIGVNTYKLIRGDSPFGFVFGQKCNADITQWYSGTYNVYYRPFLYAYVNVIDAYSNQRLQRFELRKAQPDSTGETKYVRYDDVTLRYTYNDAANGYYVFKWGAPCAGSQAKTCHLGQITEKNQGDYYVYLRQKRSLTGRAWDDYAKNWINVGGNCQSTQSDVWQGYSASVKRSGFSASCRTTLNSNYTWKGWDIGGSTCPGATGDACATSSLVNNTTVKAVYTKNVWQGRILASGSSNAKASASGDGYTAGSATNTAFINNCDNGCNVTFTSQLRRLSGSGSTKYSVSRTSSNLKTTPRAIQNVSFGGGWGGNTTSGQTVKTDGTLRLYPGMFVCEEMTFDAAADSTNRVIKLCLLARGNAQPGDPANTDTEESPDVSALNGDGAFLNIKVRNQSVNNQNKYRRQVYGKPGDTFSYRASYNPTLQYAYYLRLVGGGTLDRLLINGGNAVTGNGQMIGALFNNKVNPDWRNGFSIYKKDIRSESMVGNYPNYTIGAIDKQSPDENSVTVQSSDVGSDISETASTNRVTNASTTPGQISFVNADANVSTARRDSKAAHGYVPYNFVIDASITTAKPDDANSDGSPSGQFFAGEGGAIGYSVTVGPKINRATTNNATSDEAYTTNVKNSRHKLIVYYPTAGQAHKRDGGTLDGNINSDVCSYFGYTGGNASHCGTIDSGVTNLTPGTHNISKSIYVQDSPAGSELCVAVAVFPASSGADTNWNDLNYDRKWRITDSNCYKVAKRPSMQVWGGNIYSVGALRAARTIKRSLNGYSGYDPNTDSVRSHYVFGSWGEHGIISRSEVSGFASGATLGYGSNNNGVLSPNPMADNSINPPTNPGGSNDTNFFKQSVLTIANTVSTVNSVTGTNGLDANEALSLATNAVEALVDGITNVQAVENEVRIDVDGGSAIAYKSSGDLTVTSNGTLRKGTIRAVKASNITINDNITIDSGAHFDNLRQVPKAVFYATNNIYIGCNVTKLNAVLYAERVITCNNIDNEGSGSLNDKIARKINDKANSNQLYISGAVLAGRLYANRTYGSGDGANSIVPAEIIDFDPSLFAWGGVAGSTDEDDEGFDGVIETTYITDLPPRY